MPGDNMPAVPPLAVLADNSDVEVGNRLVRLVVSSRYPLVLYLSLLRLNDDDADMGELDLILS